MSKDIENKVVSMEFDNSKFEKPAKETISTIDKLKEALHFKNVTKGFEAMQQGIKSVTFAPIEKGIDSVYAKFTFMERFTIQLYDRLANKIISTGHMIASETFTRPISTGKSEYEEKMGAVQTIMASSKKSLAEVNDVLEELNKYADDTIYSFRDMTTSIGKFTNAGVDLKDAVAAIKGISNEAALSGANADEASRAMYNFAQALSSGAVKLIDWKSIENANMATKEFKQELIDTAVAEGQLTKQADGYYRTLKGKTFTATAKFNDALQDQWMTSDVLIKTLKRYGDANTDVGRRATAAATEVKTFSMLIDTLKEALQSGWTESWEHIIGDFDQAKRLWTDLSTVLGGLIDRMATARNTMLKFWAQFGGRTALLQGITNAWRALTSILGAVRDAFRSVVPPMTGRRLVDITKRFEQFTKKLVPSIATVQRTRDFFIGLFNVFGIGVDAVKAFVAAFKPLATGLFKYLTSSVLGASGGFKSWALALRAAIKEGQVFERLFGGIADVLLFVGRVLKEVFSTIGRVIDAFRSGGMSAGFAAIKTEFVALFETVLNLFRTTDPLGKLRSLGKSIAQTISNWPIVGAFVHVLSSIYHALESSPLTGLILSIFEGLFTAIQTILARFAGIDTRGVREGNEKIVGEFKIFSALKRFISTVFSTIADIFSKFAPIFKKLGSAIASVLKEVFSVIERVLRNSDLGDVGQFLAGNAFAKLTQHLTGFIKKLKKNKTSLQSIAESLSAVLGAVGDAIGSFAKQARAKALKETAIALAILAGSLLVISAIPRDEVAAATVVIAELMATLTVSMNKLSASANGVKGAAVMATASLVFISLASAVAVLSASLLLLSFIDYDAATKGVIIIGSLVAIMVTAVRHINTGPGVVFAAAPILAMAAFVLAVSLALIPLGIISAKNENAIVASVGAVVAIIAAMTAAVRAISSASKFGGLISIGPILAMSIAMLSISLALTPLGLLAKLDPDALKLALFGFIAVLSVFTLAVIAIGKTASIKSIVSAAPIAAMVGVLIAVSASLSILTLIAKLDPEAMIAAMTALTIALTAVSAVYILVSKMASNLAILRVAPFVAMSSALIVLTGSLALLTLAVHGREEAMLAALKGILAVMTMMFGLCMAIGKVGSLKTAIKMAPFLLLVNMLTVIVGALSLFVVALHGRLDAAATAAVVVVAVFAALGGLLTAMAVILSKIRAPSIGKIIKLSAMALAMSALMVPVIGILSAIGAVLASAGGSSEVGLFKMLARFAGVIAVLILLPPLFKKLTDEWGVIDALKLMALGFGLRYMVDAVIITTAAMKDVSLKDIAKLILLAGGLSAVGVLLSAAASMGNISSGASTFSKIAVAMSAALLAIARAFDSLTKTDIDFARLKKNIQGLATTLVDCREDIAMALGALLSGLLSAVLSSVYETLKTALTETLDMLISIAPEASKKIADLFVILAETIKDQAPRLAEALVTALISVVKSLANAVNEHSTEIVDAIDSLFEAILKVIIKALGRVFGVSKEKLESFANKIVPIIKPIAMAIAGMFAISKLTSVVTVFLHLIGRAALGIKSFAIAAKTSATGAVASIGTGFTKILGVIRTFVAANASLLGIGSAAIAIGLGLKTVIDKQTKSMQVASNEDLKASEALNKLRSQEEQYQSVLKDRKQALDDAKQPYEAAKLQVDQLDKLIDKDGKVLQGKEEQFKILQNQLSSVLQIKIAEDGTVQIINDQNEALKYQKTALEDILKRKQLTAQLDSQQAKYTEAVNRRNSGELQKNIADAQTALMNFDKERYIFNNVDTGMSRKEFMDRVEMYKKLHQQGVYVEDAINEAGLGGLGFANVGRIVEAYDNAVSARSAFVDAVKGAETIWARNESYIQAYDTALESANGDLEIFRQNIEALARNDMSVDMMKKFGSVTSEIDLSELLNQLQGMARYAEENGVDYNKELAKTLSDGARSIATKLTEAGYGDRVKLIFSQFGIDAGTAMGGDLYEAFASAFSSKMSSLQIVKIFDDAQKKNVIGWEVLAKEDVQGYINGLEKSQGKVYATVEDLSAGAANAWAKEHKINSPSKVFEQYGIFDMLGLINGIASKETDITKAYSAMGAAAIAAYTASTNQNSSIAWAPLIDTTGIQNGTAAMQKQFGALQTSLPTSMTSKLAASVDTSSINMDNSKIVESLGFLQEQLAELQNVMANMQVVMDSGQLVGALAPGMDAELGRRVVRKERGV